LTTIQLQALVNGNRQQTQLAHSIRVDSPFLQNIKNEFTLTPEQEEIQKQQNLYQFYQIDATPSTQSLLGLSPLIPSIGKDLSEAL
jgi:hypothetical protein